MKRKQSVSHLVPASIYRVWSPVEKQSGKNSIFSKLVQSCTFTPLNSLFERSCSPEISISDCPWQLFLIQLNKMHDLSQ